MNDTDRVLKEEDWIASRKPLYFGGKHDGRFVVIDRQRVDKEKLELSPHDTVIEVYSNGRPVSEAVHIIDPNAQPSQSSVSPANDNSTFAVMLIWTLVNTGLIFWILYLLRYGGLI